MNERKSIWYRHSSLYLVIFLMVAVGAALYIVNKGQDIITDTDATQALQNNTGSAGL